MLSQLEFSRLMAICQEKSDNSKCDAYNPSPYQFEVDSRKALGIEIPKKKIFPNGDLEKPCCVCNNARSQSGYFGMCPRCHYDRFFGLIMESTYEQPTNKQHNKNTEKSKRKRTIDEKDNRTSDQGTENTLDREEKALEDRLYINDF